MTAIITGERFTEELPGMAKMSEFMDWYDSAAKAFKDFVTRDDLHGAALTLKLMFSMDRWLADHKFEA